MGLDIYIIDLLTNDELFHDIIDEADNPFPGHICHKQYLRSSYNNGGFNQTVGNLINQDLYTIFQYKDDYSSYLDENDEDSAWGWSPTIEQLKAARLRAIDVRDQLLAIENPFCAQTISATSYKKTETTDSINFFEYGHNAIKIVNKEIESHKNKPNPYGLNYSSSMGHFWLKDPLMITAAIPGKDIFGEPAITLIYNMTADNYKFYTDMAEIIILFIDHAITMRHPFITWSS